jgi:hypothetical protein
MEVWFDDIVIATEYVGPVRGRPKKGKKKARPSRSALLTGKVGAKPGKAIFTQGFEKGTGKFDGGQVVAGGASGGKALSFGPKGCSCWEAFSTPVADSTTIRLKLKPLCDVGRITVMVWSKKRKDNCRYYIGGLKKGQWRTVEFKAIECRTGWGRQGPSLDGDVLNNIKLLYEGAAEDRILLDDFEVCR